MNEYQKKFTEQIKTDSDKNWNKKREQLVNNYGWVIPTTQIIDVLSQPETILEIGAGNGYLASEVNKNGGSIYPTDMNVPDDTWTTVYPATVQDIIENPSLAPTTDVILSVWPPANSELANRILSELSPSLFYYIGFIDGTITGSSDMSTYLKEYQIQDQIPLEYTWTDKQESLYVFSQRNG